MIIAVQKCKMGENGLQPHEIIISFFVATY